ncbi:hypothetical protein BBJ28_00025865, partial [Nothophytophthora sp. Chile5]
MPISSPKGGLASPRASTDYMDLALLTKEAAGQSSFTRSRKSASVASEDGNHRDRFLSDAERVLAQNPLEARLSLASLDAADQKHWHSTPTDAIVKTLGTDVDRGLSEAQVEDLLTECGLNELEAEPRTPLHIVFLLQFYNLIIGMLLFASIASISLQEYVDGIAILFIVTLNAVVATIQENSAGNALEALAKLSSPRCTVVRDGSQQDVESNQLVPGDIVLLVTGDVVPADIRLYHSVDLKSNEMLLTGESEDVSKKYNAPLRSSDKTAKLTASNMVFSSTTITAGNARGIVVETGMSTRVGSIAALLRSTQDDSDGGEDADGHKKPRCHNPVAAFINKHQPKLTPLQRSLHKLGFVMGTIALTVCALVFIVGLLRGTRDMKDPERPVWLTMIMTAVSLAVSAVPEGLPMVVTICLSSGTSDMVKKNVLVRKLAAVETLGAASVICTDKTGTLTEGKMTAVKLWGDFKTYDITGKGFTPEGGIFLNGVSQIAPDGGNAQVRATLLASVLCSNTHLTQQQNEEEDDDDAATRWVPVGNSSEAPLIVAAAKAGIWEEYVAEQYKRVVEVPFSSSRKMMVTVNQLQPGGRFGALRLTVPKSGGESKDAASASQVQKPASLVACVKGAPNFILDNCTHFCQTNGSLAPLAAEQRQEVLAAVDDLSSQALRVIAVALQPLGSELPYAPDCDDVDEKFLALSQPLVLLGLVASIDPERDGVRDAIDNARQAGIRTIMITGDYLKTAIAIAKNVELLQIGANADDEATDCATLRPRGSQYLPEAEIDAITSQTLVFAR